MKLMKFVLPAAIAFGTLALTTRVRFLRNAAGL